MRFSDQVIEETWRLTKDVLKNDRYILATDYLDNLRLLAKMPPPQRYKRAFPRDKNSGGSRLIKPAGPMLAQVQHVLAAWLIYHKQIQLGDDYCYLGRRGPLAAVKTIQRTKPNYGVVFDFKNAFDCVTARLINRWLLHNLPSVDLDVIKFIVDLVTFEGKTPQGCASSPFFYNLVVKPIDDLLRLHANKHGLTYIRYSDNLCFASAKQILFEELGNLVSNVSLGHGFRLNEAKTSYFVREPIIFLGTRISGDQLTLVDGKVDDYESRLLEAYKSPTPEIYRKEINGILVWAYQVCQHKIPPHLLDLFDQYYQKVGKPPETLQKAHTKKLI